MDQRGKMGVVLKMFFFHLPKNLFLPSQLLRKWWFLVSQRSQLSLLRKSKSSWNILTKIWKLVCSWLSLRKCSFFVTDTFSIVRGAGGPNWPFACLYYFEHSNISVFSKIYLPEIKRLPLATAPRSLAATTLECRNLFPIVRSICWWGLWWWSSWSSWWLLSSGLLSSLLWIGWMVSTHRSQFVSNRSFQLLRRHRMLILWS